MNRCNGVILRTPRISAFLEVEGKKYIVALCSYSFRQHVDHRGRPRSKVRKGPVYVELYATEDTENLVAWSLSDWKTLSGKIVFSRPTDGEATLKHLWFTHAFCTGYRVDFDSTGTTGGASLRVSFTISPEDMGVDSGNGESWVAPPPREYAAPKAIVAAAIKAPVAPPATAAELAEAKRLGATVKKSVSKELGYPALSELHKAATREMYLAKKKAAGKPAKEYAAWEKSYLTALNNNIYGNKIEDDYRGVFGGISAFKKTAFTQRQIYILREDERYCGQLKTGKLNLGEQEKKDLKKDAWLIKVKGYTVEYILEKGGSKPLIGALTKIGAKITIGRQI